MNRRKRVAAGLGSTVLVLGAGAGLATAARSGTGGASGLDDIVNSTGPPPGSRGERGGGPGTAAILAYLGLTQAQLRTGLQGGLTLAQIATGQGKTVSGLESAIVADAKSHLDAAVAAGKLTTAQEATMLAEIGSHVADMVDSTGPPPGRPPA